MKDSCRYYFLGLLCTTSVAVYGQSTVAGTRFQWPDASRYNRVIVNAQQGVESYPKQWFSRDILVTDLTIANAHKLSDASAEEQYKALRDTLTSYGLTTGTYISGTTVEPIERETKYPWAVVPLESMPESAIYTGTVVDEPYRKVIDVSDLGTRRAFQSVVKSLWEVSPATVRFIDNAAVHASAGREQGWASYCLNMKELRELAEGQGAVAIFNVAVHPGEMSDAETSELIEAIGHGGLMLEMPWHTDIRKNPAATERARSRYRQLLDAGVAIIMAEPGAEPSNALVDWVNSWRKPTDHIYFAGAFWKQPSAKYFGTNAPPALGER